MNEAPISDLQEKPFKIGKIIIIYISDYIYHDNKDVNDNLYCLHQDKLIHRRYA